MSQSNIIVGALFFAFFIYVTARGQLGQYISVFL